MRFWGAGVGGDGLGRDEKNPPDALGGFINAKRLALGNNKRGDFRKRTGFAAGVDIAGFDIAFGGIRDIFGGDDGESRAGFGEYMDEIRVSRGDAGGGIRDHYQQMIAIR